MQGIPTMYRGTLFRSRNEARFACLFDELVIPWQYEPADLVLYMPDFMIHGDLLAEIKPDIDSDTMRIAQVKIERSHWNGEAVILTPLVEQDANQPLVGSFGEVDDGPDGPQLVWSGCRVMRCLSCNQPSFFPEAGSWHCRRCGADGGNAHVGAIGPDFSKAWNEAGNRTQWRAA